MPEADPTPPPRPLEACWEPDQESLDLYLAIPEYRPGGYNVSVALDRNTRYAAEVLMRRDKKPASPKNQSRLPGRIFASWSRASLLTVTRSSE